MGAAGIAGTFAPAEIAAALSLGSSSGTALLIQLFAGLLFAFAMVNWTARRSLMGGIYNRPIAIGNLTHFVIGSLALARAVAAGERQMATGVATTVYVVFAVGFAVALFHSPVQSRDQP